MEGKEEGKRKKRGKRKRRRREKRERGRTKQTLPPGQVFRELAGTGARDSKGDRSVHEQGADEAPDL